MRVFVLLLGIVAPFAERAAAQEPLPPLPPTPERSGSPVETLESLTGERIREPEAERPEEPDEIETDRDSFTPATTVVGRHRLVTELAYSFTDHRGIKDAHSYPELLLRYGVMDRVELRLGWNYEVGGAGNEASGFGQEDPPPGETGLERVSRVVYGAKIQVTRQKEWLPRSALILAGRSPTSGATNDTQFFATYVFGWEFRNRWKLDAAVRYSTASEGEDRFHVWYPSVVLKVPVGERWAVHAEYFGGFSSGKEEAIVRQYFSPGAHVLLNPNLEVGARVGWGLNDQTARFFVNAGLGWRY